MKKGQLLSQPFFYIFAIVTIGLLLVFGFNYVGKIMKTGCEVEGLDFNNKIQAKINELITLSAGSSFECAVTRASGTTKNSCELVLPDSALGVCFIDTDKGYQQNDISFKEIKTLVTALGRGAHKNMFFAPPPNAQCKSEPVKLKKLTTEGAVCVDPKLKKTFILESLGDEVIVKKA